MMTAIMEKWKEFQKSCKLLAVDMDKEFQKFQQKYQEIDEQIKAPKDNYKNKDITNEINQLTIKLKNTCWWYPNKYLKLNNSLNIDT